MKIDFENVKAELEKRGLKDISKEDINSWAIVFALENLIKRVGK